MAFSTIVKALAWSLALSALLYSRMRSSREAKRPAAINRIRAAVNIALNVFISYSLLLLFCGIKFQLRFL